PWHMNGRARGRYVKVKICLGRGESPEEPTNLQKGRIRPTTIPQVEGCRRVRESEPFLDGRLREFRIRVRRVEDVPASGWVVDRHIERRTRDDVGRCDGRGPPLPLMDHDLPRPEGTNAFRGLDGRAISRNRAHLGLIPEE